MTRTQDHPTWLRFGGIGLEFAAAVAVFILIGYWVDRNYGSSPKGVLIGAILGIIGGGYNFIRQSLMASRQAVKESTRSSSKDQDDA